MEKSKPTSILIADDDSVLRDMYRLRLIQEGYEVSEAIDGQQVLDMLKGDKPDLILLDIMMPKMNGLDVLKVIKSDEATKHIPVILLTALIQDMREYGSTLRLADDMVIKSETIPSKLVNRIKEILDKNKSNSKAG